MRQSHASCASLSPRLTRWLCRAAAALARAGKRAPGVSGSRGREIWRSRELESNYQVTPGAVTLSLCQLLSAARAVLVTCPRLAPDPRIWPTTRAPWAAGHGPLSSLPGYRAAATRGQETRRSTFSSKWVWPPHLSPLTLELAKMRLEIAVIGQRHRRLRC